MLHFLLKLDFPVLSKYVKFHDSDKPLDVLYENGYPITMDYYYTDELVKDCEDGFRKLLNKHSLGDHFENLLFLCLSGLQKLESNLYESEIINTQRIRIKELGHFLLMFEESTEKETINLLAKGFRNTAKITDQTLSRYIGRIVKENIIKGNYQLGELAHQLPLLLGSENGDSEISIKKLHELADTKVINMKQLQKTYTCELAFTLLGYLNGETQYTSSSNTNFSDAQLDLLYDILIYFELLKEGNFDKTFDYEPKDFMRNYLIKYAKSLKIRGNGSNQKSTQTVPK
ncbi:MAG: hypothetical protein V4708_01595 [Bacteroidota bacterium]